MANFIKAYYQKQNYPNQVIHVVTRLDRDTSGLMLFAKHGFAHALLDYQLRSGKVVKKYQAWVASSERLEDSGEIIAPIGRDERSIIARMVRSDGKPAHTSYQTLRSYPRCRLVDIRLHTGRTHQIRVHFSFLGAPLLGDTLYGGTDTLINRQALHCYFLEFWHPFLSKTITLEINLPRDMQTIKAQL
jgi:23S rRNA pseudouridine1911/1915/1917 synthase